MEGGHDSTGTPNATYNLVSIMYHALQAAETGDRYIADAEAQGDADLAAFFREVQQEDRRRADRAKQLLSSRLQAMGSSPGSVGVQQQQPSLTASTPTVGHAGTKPGLSPDKSPI
jgi:hypothetical protein